MQRMDGRRAFCSYPVLMGSVLKEDIVHLPIHFTCGNALLLQNSGISLSVRSFKIIEAQDGACN